MMLLPQSEAARVKLTESGFDELLKRAKDRSKLVFLRFLTEESFKRARAQTGTYARSWIVTVKPPGFIIVNTARGAGGFNYPIALEFGTGIFGPRKRKITPIRAQALSWIPSKPLSAFRVSPTTEAGREGGRVFFKSVKGIKPRRVAARAIARAFPAILKTFSITLQGKL